MRAVISSSPNTISTSSVVSSVVVSVVASVVVVVSVVVAEVVVSVVASVAVVVPVLPPEELPPELPPLDEPPPELPPFELLFGLLTDTVVAVSVSPSEFVTASPCSSVTSYVSITTYCARASQTSPLVMFAVALNVLPSSSSKAPSAIAALT